MDRLEMVECDAFLGGKKLIAKEKLTFRPAAYAIILNDGKVLLLTNQRTDKYALPGGGSNLGERLEDTLKREVKEETGIEIQIEEFLFWRESFFYYDPLDLAFHTFQFFYRCVPLKLELIADDLVDDEESKEPRWIEIASVKAAEMQWLGKEITEWLTQISNKNYEPPF